MAETYPTVELSRGTIRLIGGAVALDFANTVGWRLSDEPSEWLLGYGDLVTWAKGTGFLDAARARRLTALAKAAPAKAERVLAEARALRGTLFAIVHAISRSAAPKDFDLAALNRAIARHAPRNGIEKKGRRLSWRWPDDSLESVLAPILWSAGDLLAGTGTDRLKICAADGCGWMFLDASRKANRLWCSMDDCGNRAKASRHYRRTRKSA